MPSHAGGKDRTHDPIHPAGNDDCPIDGERIQAFCDCLIDLYRLDWHGLEIETELEGLSLPEGDTDEDGKPSADDDERPDGAW